MRRHSALVALALLVMAAPAAAEPYMKAEGWLANTAEPNACNIGGAVGAGYDFGAVRLEGELSQHMHLCNGTAALTVMAYAEPWSFGRWTPYLGIGGGATMDDPVYQGAAGVSYDMGEFSLTGGYVHRCYDERCESRDGAVMAGIRKEF